MSLIFLKFFCPWAKNLLLSGSKRWGIIPETEMNFFACEGGNENRGSEKP
jgi:hypothetical protein